MACSRNCIICTHLTPGSGGCMFTKVYCLHAIGCRGPCHAHKSVLFTRNQVGGSNRTRGGAPKVDFGEGMYINQVVTIENTWPHSHPPSHYICNSHVSLPPLPCFAYLVQPDHHHLHCHASSILFNPTTVFTSSIMFTQQISIEALPRRGK